MTPAEPPVAPSPRRLLVAALLLYAFALAARIGPPAIALELPVYRAGGEWLLIEPDGYLYLTGARDRLAGNPAANPRAEEDGGLSVVAATLARLTGWPLGEVAFFLPAFAGSLLVVPVLLLGTGGGSLLAGVLAAMLAATAWGHLYRTIPGYFTPEMLNVVLPTSAALCAVRSFESRRAIWGWGGFAGSRWRPLPREAQERRTSRRQILRLSGQGAPSPAPSRRRLPVRNRSSPAETWRPASMRTLTLAPAHSSGFSSLSKNAA